MKQKEFCHVCKKPKEDYNVYMNKSAIGMIKHKQAREDGPICERCNGYFAMTGDFKDASDTEFELAKQAAKFARDVLKWWEKDEQLVDDEDLENTNFRYWSGTAELAKWYRGVKP